MAHLDNDVEEGGFGFIGRVGHRVKIQEPRPAALELALPRAAHGLALRVRHDDIQEMEGTDLLRAVLLEREHVQRPRRARLQERG